jgi:hypothetical protein
MVKAVLSAPMWYNDRITNLDLLGVEADTYPLHYAIQCKSGAVILCVLDFYPLNHPHLNVELIEKICQVRAPKLDSAPEILLKLLVDKRIRLPQQFYIHLLPDQVAELEVLVDQGHMSLKTHWEDPLACEAFFTRQQIRSSDDELYLKVLSKHVSFSRPLRSGFSPVEIAMFAGNESMTRHIVSLVKQSEIPEKVQEILERDTWLNFHKFRDRLISRDVEACISIFEQDPEIGWFVNWINKTNVLYLVVNTTYVQKLLTYLEETCLSKNCFCYPEDIWLMISQHQNADSELISRFKTHQDHTRYLTFLSGSWSILARSNGFFKSPLFEVCVCRCIFDFMKSQRK